MNCPHHHRVYASSPRSYRELPLRLAEYGQVYRFEDSGAVGGLVRVRGMCMNDAHIYCTAEQVKDEFKAVMAMYAEAYAILGLDSYTCVCRARTSAIRKARRSTSTIRRRGPSRNGFSPR